MSYNIIMRIEAVIFDFGRTLYDTSTGTTFPEAIPTLISLKERELKLGLVTIAVTDDTGARMRELEELEIKDYFESIDVIGRSVRGKDFSRVLGEFNLLLTPEKCMVVGDNLKREITSGNKIGAYTVWTRQNLSGKWLPQNEEQTPRAIIDNLSQIIPLVDGLNE